MSSKYRDNFFSEKRHWSSYKDAVLGTTWCPIFRKSKNSGSR